MYYDLLTGIARFVHTGRYVAVGLLLTVVLPRLRY